MFFGEICALLACFCWTINSIVCEKKGLRFSAFSINFGRQIIAFTCYAIVIVLFNPVVFKTGVSFKSFFWLGLSGFVGFTLGDSFMISAFSKIGAQLTLLIFSFSPVVSAILGYFLFDEKLSIKNILGMFLVIFGIIFVILKSGDSKGEEKIKVDLKGIIFAFLASFGQAFGVVFSKYGLLELDPLTAAEIRLIGALVGIIVLVTLKKGWKDVKHVFSTGDGRLTIGTNGILGTFIGVLLSMYAIKLSKAAVASTLMSLSPIMILPMVYIAFKQRVKPIEYVGAVLSVVGVALLM